MMASALKLHKLTGLANYYLTFLETICRGTKHVLSNKKNLSLVETGFLCGKQFVNSLVIIVEGSN